MVDSSAEVKWSRWSDTELKQLRSLRMAGATREAIARKIGRSIHAVSNMMIKFGLQQRMKVIVGRNPLPEIEEQIRVGYEKGESATVIAHRLGCSRPVITSYARRNGLAHMHRKFVQPTRAETKEARKHIATLYAQGMTCKEIAKVLGVGRKTIGRYAKQIGLKVRPGCLSRQFKNAAARSNQVTLEKHQNECKDFAISHGWPSHLKFRQVQILNLLAVHGPMTRYDLMSKTGLSWGGLKNYLLIKAKAALVDTGFVVRTLSGKGAPVFYMLTTKSIEMIETHLQRKGGVQ